MRRVSNLRSSNLCLTTTSASLAVAICLVLLSSCTTSLSLSDCSYTDWYSKGLADGVSGATKDRYSAYEEDCSRYAITPDRASYMDGRQKGLDSYCTKARGYEMGMSGHEYMDVCPTTLESGFLAGYNPGRRLHDAEHEVKSINSSISKVQGVIAYLEREIEKFETELLQGRNDEQLTRMLKKQIKLYQLEIFDSQFELLEYVHLLTNVMSSYRETVREVKDLGFAVVERY